jgi:hypothetical protein
LTFPDLGATRSDINANIMAILALFTEQRIRAKKSPASTGPSSGK